jgi:hypothetical protein
MSKRRKIAPFSTPKKVNGHNLPFASALLYSARAYR